MAVINRDVAARAALCDTALANYCANSPYPVKSPRQSSATTVRFKPDKGGMIREKGSAAHEGGDTMTVIVDGTE
jgi:hypothetical protein